MASLAVVPDGMPPLKAGTWWRCATPGSTTTSRALPTGEGNAVLRLLCPSSTDAKDAPAFRACASQAKWHQPWGEEKWFFQGILAARSGRPYAASLKDHPELSFRPYYDADGKPLPTAMPMGERPDIRNWVFPTAR